VKKLKIPLLDPEHPHPPLCAIRTSRSSERDLTQIDFNEKTFFWPAAPEFSYSRCLPPPEAAPGPPLILSYELSWNLLLGVGRGAEPCRVLQKQSFRLAHKSFFVSPERKSRGTSCFHGDHLLPAYKQVPQSNHLSYRCSWGDDLEGMKYHPLHMPPAMRALHR